MAEKNGSGKKSGNVGMLDLMSEETAPARPRTAPKGGKPQAEATDHDALFGRDDVDASAKHPADVPVGDFPAPAQVVSRDDAPPAVAEEEDPFADDVMAQMLADEPAAINSPLRAAREEMNPVPEAVPPVSEDAQGAPADDLMADFAAEQPIADTPTRAAAPEPVVMAEASAVSAIAEPILEASRAPGEESVMPAAAEPQPAAPAAKNGKTKPASAKGLTFPRRYTQPGQDVWATTEYDIRSASIVGSDGTIVFEQKGVEIPTAWSQLATNVVVSKYFRGHVGTLEREYSVKQLIGRVADRILEWAKAGSYFATEEDADTFHDELRYILLHQYAAFNSPVWFNLGWQGRRQAVSACLPYEVRVNTNRGLIPIGEIVRYFQAEPDAQVYTYAPDGTPSRIVAAVCNGRKRVVNFHLADGATLRCTSNHMVFVRDSKGGIQEKEAGDLQVGIDRLVLSRTELLPEVTETRLGLLTPDAELAWLTGLMVGDGYCGRSQTLTSDTWDLKINTPQEKRRAESVLAKYGVPFRTHEKAWGFCLRGHGAVSREFWQALGVWGRVNDKAVPEWVYRAARPLVCAFLGGLFDADGHVSQNGNRRLPVFSNTSLPLMQGVQTLLRSLGIYGTLTAYQDPRADYMRKTSYTLGIHDNVSVDQFEALIGFTHEGKQARMQMRQTEAALSWRTPDVLVVSKTLGGPEYVYDIQTECATFWAEGILLHNCYINEVDDTMESILDLYKTEGMLFKDGSGSGLNLSVLRSSKEKLAAGGRSSGPISFMKGLDASAGSIKSGGSTRRAACMRVLDIDHPDIGEFIDCKKDAELKAHALIDAGYSGAFNVVGGAYDTVPFQNANHSVRVTDEFMQAVDDDGPWDTKFRTTGKTAETVRARDLMRGIAEGTWVCGDPGMQYDTTINDWHTCINTDRIYASNPCVTSDTLVATAEGWQRIDALVGGAARVIGADGQPHFVNHIFPTGTKPTFKLRTRAGYEVTITDNHQVLTVERGDVAVKDLQIGEHLHLQGAGFGRRTLSETLAFALGMAVGDGCLTRQTIRGREQEYVVLTASNEEAPLLRKIAEELNHQKTILRAAGLSGSAGGASVREECTPGSSRLAVGSASVISLFKEFAVLDQGSERKQFSPAIFTLDKPALAAALRGLFTADGTVANYGDKSQYVSLDSTSQELLAQVQTLLLSFGIKAKLYTERRGGNLEGLLPNSARERQAYAVQEMHSLHISRSSRVIFEREIGFDPMSAKQARLHEMNSAFAAYADTLTDAIASITPAGVEDVYDLTEGVTHHFVANGLVVHNCSEYMFLGSTACNLSSLNLMKFRNDDASFDVASFEHAIRVMLTAQEIVVGFAAYPTPKIEERSHVYRTLGLGYANLGALLMAGGLPYDSPNGRAYAGAVTAIMTGTAYHQSATIARDCGGPFGGYAENKEPMLRVIGKHRAAVDAIDQTLVPDGLWDAAVRAWDGALAEGTEHGYRNAQVTVLAPTGCLVAGSLVITDRGVVRLDRLGDVGGAQWQDVRFGVLTDGGKQEATKFYVNGLDQTRRIQTQCGYAIQGTPKHRVKVVDAQTGRWDWKHFADIAPGDVVPLSLGEMIGQAQTVALPPLGEEYWTGNYATRVPQTMTADLAELIGYFMGDGSLHTKGPRFCVANTDLDVAERLQFLMKSLFNLEARLTPQQGYCEVSAHSVPLALWWDACGFSKIAPHAEHTGKGYLPRIPDAVLAANDPAIYGAFLRGLYEADGTVTGGIPCWSSTHREFSEEVKTLLLALGIPTTTKRDTTGWGQSSLYVLRLRNTSYAARFQAAVGFMSARKASAVSRSNGVQTARHDYIYLAQEIIRELVPQDSTLRNAVTLSMKRHHGAITRRSAEALYAATGDARIAHALHFFYDSVTVNEDGGEQMTYDLSVPANVTYVAQGFVSHNTIGFLMDCDTTGIEPDIAIVKYKTLVGGGMMKIVNQTVPEALQRLGYDQAQVQSIVHFIDENDTVEGAPDLLPEHLPIFDCAFRPMNGTRSIHYRGHIKMMAAAQPFISGAISKTVNVPEDASPEDIAATYIEAWRLGLKAIAVYRDNSKKTQPLNTGNKEGAKADKAALASPQDLVAPKAVRHRLPDERVSLTHKFSIGGHEGYLTVGLYPDTQQPGEIFIRMSKEGSSISGLMDSFATAISLALQYGVPLQTLVDKFIHSRFEPSGFTGNKEIPMAKSVMDYIFRYLALKYIARDQRQNVGLIGDQDYDKPAPAPPNAQSLAHDSNNGTLSSAHGHKNGSAPAQAGFALPDNATASITEHEQAISRMQSDAPPCPDCGAITIRSGACYKCLSCGTSLGCS